MNCNDIRFNENSLNLLNGFIGKKMDSFSCERLEYTPSVYGMAVVSVDNKQYRFLNTLEVLDYFGETEDVGVFKFEETNNLEINKFLEGGELTTTLVDQKIVEICVINEEQKLLLENLTKYDLKTVRGIIFVLEDGREVSFEKDIWFSEMIIIRTGHNLIKEFDPGDDFFEDWENSNYEPRLTRVMLRATQKFKLVENIS